VLFAAVLLQAVAMLIFATAASVSELIVARIVQGISAGAAVGAAGAGLLDISHHKGALANSVGPMTGTATGAIVSGVLVQYFPAPLHLVYCMFFAIFVMQAVGVALMAESVSLKTGGARGAVAAIHLPPAVRAPMLFAVPTLLRPGHSPDFMDRSDRRWCASSRAGLGIAGRPCADRTRRHAAP